MHRHTRRAAGAALLAAGMLIVPLPGAAGAREPDTVVTTHADSLAHDGLCSLREAVLAANVGRPVDACANAHAVELGPGQYDLAIPGVDEDTGLTGDLDIAAALTISGAGSSRTTVDAHGLDRIFDVEPGAIVTIENLTVTGGSLSWEAAEPDGGGIRNASSLTLRRVVVEKNSSAGRGGGIASRGTLVVVGATVADNWSFDGSGGIDAVGTASIRDAGILRNISSSNAYDAGGIGVDGQLQLAQSVVAGNHGSGEWPAGGVAMNGGTVVETTIRDNVTGSCGTAGIRMVNAVLESSTVSGNRAGYCAYAGGVDAVDSTIVNSTVSGNTAGEFWLALAAAGGIRASGSRIVDTTVTDNAYLADPSLEDPELLPHAAAGVLGDAVNATATGTIIAGNVEPWPDCAGAVMSAGSNLVGTVVGCSLGPSDLRGNPLLGPLADNGGPTQTHALLPGSRAIDVYGCDVGCPRVDQRGVHRPQDGNGDGSKARDIGAVEMRRH